jgi:hypothetical protein
MFLEKKFCVFLQYPVTYLIIIFKGMIAEKQNEENYPKRKDICLHTIVFDYSVKFGVSFRGAIAGCSRNLVYWV